MRRQLGHGGIAAVARAAGVSTGCVSRGLVELEDDAEPDDRVRRRGAGRPALAAKDPGLRAALLALVEDSTQGDPIGPLTWTTKPLRHLATELAAQGRAVGRDATAALLKEAGFSLRTTPRSWPVAVTGTAMPSSTTSTTRCASSWTPATR